MAKTRPGANAARTSVSVLATCDASGVTFTRFSFPPWPYFVFTNPNRTRAPRIRSTACAIATDAFPAPSTYTSPNALSRYFFLPATSQSPSLWRCFRTASIGSAAFRAARNIVAASFRKFITLEHR